MGIEQTITELQKVSAEQTAASQALSQEVAGKMGAIDKKADDFGVEAKSLVAAVSSDIRRAMIGNQRTPLVRVDVTDSDDAGALVNKAFNEGAKSVVVNWLADGRDRNWNTYVLMPVGTTLSISGPKSTVAHLGGSVRSGRTCWKNGTESGVSEHGSPMIFRNLEVTQKSTPHNGQFKVYENSSLIGFSGNNILALGGGCYLHDEGGMTMSPQGGGLIKAASYAHGMPSYIVGGGYGTNIYISSGLVCQQGGGTDFVIRLYAGSLSKTSSDGPMLHVNRGFKRLMNEGVAGVTSDLLNMQPWEIPVDKADLNDNVVAQYGRPYYVNVRGINLEEDRPRLIIRNSWSFTGGVASIQCVSGAGQIAWTGLSKVGETNEYRASF